MSQVAGARRQFGEGPLARAAALVYALLVVELLFLLTAAPGLAVLVLLDRDASNVPLAAACVLPLGPALSAALFALARRRLDLTDLRPAGLFWRGYRLNAAGVLRIWVPFLVVVGIVGVNLTHAGEVGVPTWWATLLWLIAAVAVLWVANALVITSLFAFRAVDVARLAAYFLGRRVGVTLGNAGLLIVAAVVTAISSEAVLMLLASVLAAALLLTARPMTAEVEEKFIA
jgi:hypothetical protein